jgi:hypothetical protein
VGSLQCSQDLVTGAYSDPDETNPHYPFHNSLKSL